MSSLIFTHIESVTKRPGSTVHRVMAGTGFYDVSPNSPVAQHLDDPTYQGPVVLAVSGKGYNPTIVGMSTRDGSHQCGRIDYQGES